MSTIVIAQRPVRDAVAAGARLYDDIHPDWASHLANPNDVDVDEAELCPLGQIHPDGWLTPLLSLARSCPRRDPRTAEQIAVHWAALYGFTSRPTPGEEDDHSDPGNSPHLNHRWGQEIHVRRYAAALLAESAGAPADHDPLIGVAA